MHRNLGYAELFDARGAAYHQAMVEYPHCRKNEFETLVDCAVLKPNQRVADIPSGGGYLVDYLPPTTQYFPVETSKAFYEHLRPRAPGARWSEKLTELPFDDNELDVVFSLAGLHHEKNRGHIYAEFHRILKPGGKLVIAEVWQDTSVAKFLNGFIDAHGAGHEGWFFNESDLQLLQSSRLHLVSVEQIPLLWQGSDCAELAYFARLLFGATRATQALMRQALERHCSLRALTSRAELDWPLTYIVARK